MIRHRVHVLRLKVIDFRRRSRLEWQETKHMSRVYRDRLLGRTTGSELREAHAQAGDMLRIVILGSTQIIPLPVIPTLLVIPRARKTPQLQWGDVRLRATTRVTDPDNFRYSV